MKYVAIEAENTDYGLAPALNRHASYVGFKHLGYNVNLYSKENILNIARHNHDVIFHASMETQREIWEQLNFKRQDLPYKPEELSGWIYSPTIVCGLKETNEILKSQDLFVKPHWQYRKLFAGHILKKGSDIICENEDIKLIIDEPRKFSSEWRLFIQNGKIVGAQFYKGDFKMSPPFYSIEFSTANARTLPFCYCLDFGRNEDAKRWELIELNEILFANPYGLKPIIFAELIENRWNELKNS